MSSSFQDFTVQDATGQNVSLKVYAGHPMLVVNVASQCGFTPQYTGLEALYRKFKDRGLVVMGFPCNQFGAQEPGSNQEIQEFCKLNYDATFPIMAKVDVNGEAAHPIYKYLKSAAPGLLGTEAIKWNFTKFLVDQDGQVLHRYAPNTKPEDLEADIEKVLAGK